MEKLLVLRVISPLCHNVFKSRLLQMREHVSTGGKGIKEFVSKVNIAHNIKYY